MIRFELYFFYFLAQVNPGKVMPDLSNIDVAVKAMEFQVQAIKDRIREEKAVIPKAKVPYILTRHHYCPRRSFRRLEIWLSPLPLLHLGSDRTNFMYLVDKRRNWSSSPYTSKGNCSTCSRSYLLVSPAPQELGRMQANMGK